ncbi:hypothetical protein B0H14DRAFT_3095984 [Mycena olivaceomarginata]|nr:hypothetical protein B0H14DRAFT_3095984 [Mycena olivaceomarginata]
MVEIQEELLRIGIPFGEESNRIRCFQPVINIAVTAGLKELTEMNDPAIVDFDAEGPVPEALKDNMSYLNALRSDPVYRARGLVRACRASGQRRDNFEEAVNKFLGDPKQGEIAWHALNTPTLQILQDIRRFLEVAHVVQEIVSAEKTPTLSVVLPMYEQLIIMLKDLAKDLVFIAHGIKATIEKLEEYLAMSCRTKMYSLAMSTMFFSEYMSL